MTNSWNEFFPSRTLVKYILSFSFRKCPFNSIFLSFYDQTFINYLIALVLLGIGWNFLFIGGTSLLVLCYKESEKFKVQGFNDVLVFSIQSIASLAAGYSILKFSWNEINLACIPLVLLIILVSIRADIHKKKWHH